MIKNLKLNIKNAQLAEALKKTSPSKKKDVAKKKKEELSEETEKAKPKVHLLKKDKPKAKEAAQVQEASAEDLHEPVRKARIVKKAQKTQETQEDLKTDAPTKELETELESVQAVVETKVESVSAQESQHKLEDKTKPMNEPEQASSDNPSGSSQKETTERKAEQMREEGRMSSKPRPQFQGKSPVLRESFSSRQAKIASKKQADFKKSFSSSSAPQVKLGPTGKHIDDLKSEMRSPKSNRSLKDSSAQASSTFTPRRSKPGPGGQVAASEAQAAPSKPALTKKSTRAEEDKRKERSSIRRTEKAGRVDVMRSMDDDVRWRKKRAKKSKSSSEDLTIRPSSLSIRLPITVKELASEMKLKSSQLISKLFLQGVPKTLNDILDDETTVQLLGAEFGCEIKVDTSEEERIAITSKSIREEITGSRPEDLVRRPPVIAFMGHVDHGKTSLIDKIRSSNRVEGEAGAITQHIAAFSCQTSHGPLTILDTPGHAAFEDMRQRGAKITDVIVLVIAGDDGIMPQTDEAIKHAKEVEATIVVAINKCDKPSFNADNVYRQLAERELLPEAWGGQTITINCSAVTGEGIDDLLEMVALQSEVLELTANHVMRARGSVIEAQLHKGLGNVATILVQNGRLRHGDALVFGSSWGRVKTLRDEHNKDVESVGPGLPAVITGLESLPSAGEEFIVVDNERDAKEIAEVRLEQLRERSHSMGRRSLDILFQQAREGKKIINAILRADVQGSLEALRVALVNIKSDKAEIKIISDGIGEISESDVELAAASGATIIGFHTQVESHAVDLIKEKDVKVKCYDVIYHAVDGAKEIMVNALDKIAEEVPKAKATIKAVFKSSHTGKIAGCQVDEGKLERNQSAKLLRQGEEIWKGKISSLRRGTDDVKEVSKGFECGVVLDSFKEIAVDDEIHTFDIVYRTQTL